MSRQEGSTWTRIFSSLDPYPSTRTLNTAWIRILDVLRKNNSLTREDVLEIAEIADGWEFTASHGVFGLHEFAPAHGVFASSEEVTSIGRKMSRLELEECCDSPGEYQNMDDAFVEKAWLYIRELDRCFTCCVTICRTREQNKNIKYARLTSALRVSLPFTRIAFFCCRTCIIACGRSSPTSRAP